MVDDLFHTYWNDPRKFAPVVIVGVVEENRIVSRHVEAARYRDVYLDLHAVRCRRENTLKGGVTGPEVEFYYFADGRYPSTPNPRYKRLFEAKPGSRYLFFLTRERGVLRSIGDVGEYPVLVATGRHAERAGGNDDVGRQMSEILLTPGEGADLDLMASSMQMARSSRFADVWGSRLLTVELLRRLTLMPEPVRSSACAWLAENYYGQEGCLATIAGDASESEQNRQAAVQALKEQGVRHRRLVDELKDPATLRFSDITDGSRRGVREELQVMLFSSDLALRERVCTALRRYYPYDPDPRCSDRPQATR